jgi:hypothetical protein
MVGIESFLRAIPVAAKSPYALFAYIISAFLFVLGLYQRNQLRLVLRNLEKIPGPQRKSVIETTLNTKLPATISGEQYLRRERMKYILSAFLGALVLVVGIVRITVIMLVNGQGSLGDEKHPSTRAKIRVQLWPRPEIKEKLLKDHDARLYLKTDNAQLDLTGFVPTEDFLDETTEVDQDLIGQAVDLTVAPRDKYSIEQNRRYLTRLVRVEIYPQGQKLFPPITSLQTPSGKVFRTTDLPISSAVSIVNASADFSDPTKIAANKPYLLNVRGRDFTPDTKLEIVDQDGNPVKGAWAGNELGASNGKPVEVGADGMSMKMYFSVPSSVAGQKLAWRLENFNSSNRPQEQVFVQVAKSPEIEK